jgi:hypothetical protein
VGVVMNKGLLGIIKSPQVVKAYEDIFTGYPNINKFMLDLTNLINENKFSSITMILLSFENMDMIKRYVEYDLSKS